MDLLATLFDAKAIELLLLLHPIDPIVFQFELLTLQRLVGAVLLVSRVEIVTILFQPVLTLLQLLIVKSLPLFQHLLFVLPSAALHRLSMRLIRQGGLGLCDPCQEYKHHAGRYMKYAGSSCHGREYR